MGFKQMNDQAFKDISKAIQTALNEGKITEEQARQAAQQLASDFDRPPPMIDYTKVAEKQAEKEAQLNRPNQETPWGQTTWTKDDAGNWTQTQTLNPQSQAALDSQLELTKGRSDLAQSMLGDVGASYANPMDWGSLPAAPDAQGARDQAIQSAYSQATSRLDPQFAQSEEALRSRLLNQGFQMGDQGYEDQMANFGRQKNDAYTSAMNSAIGQGTGAMQALFGMGQTQHQQALSDMLQQRNQPLNEMNALISGQQVQSPNMPSFNSVAAPDYMGAAGLQYKQGMDAYNAQQAQDYANDPMRQMLGMGQTALGGYLGYMKAKNPYGW